VNCAFQLFGLDGLEEVVDGVGFESAKRVLVVSRSEYDEGLDVQTGEQLESVKAGHLDVEEKHIDCRWK